MDVAIVFLPLVAAAIAGLFGRAIGDKGAQAVTCLAMLASLGLAGVVFVDVAFHGHARTTPQTRRRQPSQRPRRSQRQAQLTAAPPDRARTDARRSGSPGA